MKAQRLQGAAAPAAFCALGATASLALGQDANWDLQNYHLYNAWAVLQGGRFAMDGHPAGEPTFFNPALDVLLYPLLMGMPAVAGGVLLGAFQGLAAFLVYRLALDLLGPDRRILATLAAIGGASSAMALSELGTTFHDLTTAVPLLLALRLAMHARPEDAVRRMALVGAITGVCVGVKLTNAPYAIGLAAAIALAPGPARPPRAVAAFLACAALAALLCHGWWAWILQVHYASPMFPFANSLFESPYFPPVDVNYSKFFARTPMEWLFYPFYFATSHRTAEVAFRDFRLAAAYLAVATLALAWGARRMRLGFAASLTLPSAAGAQLVAFVAASYVAWLVVFSNQRYATTLELLSVLVVFMAFALVPWPTRAAQFVVSLVIVAALAGATRVPDWKRVPYDGGRYSEVWNFDPTLEGAAALVANRPFAYLAPTTGYARTAWVGTAFNDRDRERLRRLMGPRPVVVLASGWQEREEARRVMAEYGVGISAPCSKFDSKIAGPGLACPAVQGGKFDPLRFINYTERWSFEAGPAVGEVRLAPGAETWIVLELANTGPDPLWSGVPDTLRLVGLPAREDPVGEINVSYHVLSERGEMVIYDGVRTALPRSIAPGGRLRMSLRVVAPAARGRYVLQPDVVMEGVRWAERSLRGGAVRLVVD